MEGGAVVGVVMVTDVVAGGAVVGVVMVTDVVGVVMVKVVVVVMGQPFPSVRQQ